MDTETQHEQFLTFEIADESYAVEILRVKEIRGWEPVRKIPNTPEYIKGALNLRGLVVPIIDLRERFNLGQIEYSAMTVVIVLSVETETGSDVVGIVAEAVSDVLDIQASDIKNSIQLGSKIDTCYMRGMYISAKEMVMLLDVDKLLDAESFEVVHGIGSHVR